MSCQEFAESISALADGSLPAAERPRLEIHLDACRDCRELLDDLRALRTEARALEQAPLPDGLWPRLAARLREQGAGGAADRAGSLSRRWMAVAAALVAAVGLAVLVARMYAPAGPSSESPAARPATAADSSHESATPEGGNAEAAATVEGIEAELRMAEEHYEKAIAGLEQVAAENHEARIGVRPTDRPDERLRKAALAGTSVSITVLATFWVGMYLVIGNPLAAAIPFVYQVISVVGLVYLARTGDFERFKLSQVASMLILPFLLQWVVGGFVNSGAVMVWGFFAPVAALFLYPARRAVWAIVAFGVLTLISGLIDPYVSARATPMPEPLPLVFFVLDIGFVASVTYLVLQYFVAQRERAQAETDRLLNNILPATIADRLRGGEERIADDHPSVTIVFADVAGFTQLAHEVAADEVIRILDRAFTLFDELADRYGLEKIKTIGDAYMAAAGAPIPRADHVRAAADMALGMIDAVAACSLEVGRPLSVRVGMHTGRAMAGVIGRRKFIYDIWGDAVNVASRMETTGVPGRIQVSEAVESVLRDAYEFEERGEVEIKGIGNMRTFFLVAKK
jgi:guanylate cyclase